MRKTYMLLFALALLLGLVTSTALAQKAPANVGGTVVPEQQLLDKLAKDGVANFFVKMSAEADLSAAYGMTDWNERGWFVYDTLKKVAEESQKPVIEYAKKNGLDFTSFLTTNAVFIRGGNTEAVMGLAKLPGVQLLRLERIHLLPDPTLGGAAGLNAIGPQPAAPAPNGVELGIADTNADDVWNLYGVRGAGIKVANIDTGVQWNHPALINQFACPGQPTNQNCWKDPANICGAGGACDNYGHGTHTMGTMIGWDGGANQIGMAPDATWIACKGCESSSCSEFSLNSCADWVLAPGGNPVNRPDIVNNSWGGGGGDTLYLPKVNAWRASGIFPAFSAGNNYSCASLGSPGDYQESFASAAHTSTRAIASFSSKGGSPFGHEPHTKPNISAPGENVRSSIPTNSYGLMSGTSMASPHSSGAVALLWSACPAFKNQIDLTFQTLQNNTDLAPAGSCGAPPDGEGNYTFGYGYLNIQKAVETCISGVEFGTLEGYVFDQMGIPVEGASVTATPGAGEGGTVVPGGQVQALTDPNGFYTMNLLAGTYNVTATKYGYETVTVTGVVVLANQTTVQGFTLVSIPVWMPGNPTTFQFYRHDGVFFAENGLIYFLGGRSGASTHDKSIFTYDPATGVSADTGKDMLVNAANYTVAFVADDGTARGPAFYVVGGYDVVAGRNVTDVQRFYPNSSVVEKVTTDPYPDKVANQVVGAGGVAVIDNKIYVFGGWENSAAPYFSDKTWKYDPLAAAGSRWTNLNCPLNPARSYVNSATVGTKIYAICGDYRYVSNDLVPTTAVQVFDTANPTACWTTLAPLPEATSQGRAFGLETDTEGGGPMIYMVGGGDWPAQSASVFVYSVTDNTWSSDFPSLAQARRNFAGAWVSTCTPDPTDPFPSMYVFGGQVGADDPPYGDPEYYPFVCGGGPTLHVEDITMTKRQQGGKWVLKAIITVTDQAGEPGSGADVTIEAEMPNGMIREATRTTNLAGRTTFSGGTTFLGTWTVCVTDIFKDGFVYDPSQNVETCDSITIP